MNLHFSARIWLRADGQIDEIETWINELVRTSGLDSKELEKILKNKSYNYYLSLTGEKYPTNIQVFISGMATFSGHLFLKQSTFLRLPSDWYAAGNMHEFTVSKGVSDGIEDQRPISN